MQGQIYEVEKNKEEEFEQIKEVYEKWQEWEKEFEELFNPEKLKEEIEDFEKHSII